MTAVLGAATMSPARAVMVRGYLLVGGAVLLLHTLFGLFVLSIWVYASIRDVTTAFCVILAFPIYLIGLKTLRVATWLLWAFFFAQWINECLVGVTPVLVNPFDWWRGDALFASIALVNLGYLMLSGGHKSGASVALGDAFANRV